MTSALMFCLATAVWWTKTKSPAAGFASLIMLVVSSQAIHVAVNPVGWVHLALRGVAVGGLVVIAAAFLFWGGRVRS